MKKIVTCFLLPLLALLGVVSVTSIAQSSKKSAPTGTLETLIVANGTIAMDLDLNRLGENPSGTESNRETLRFEAGRDSFFSVVVFNDELRGPQPGSLALIPTNSPRLPGSLNASFNQLVIESDHPDGAYDLVVRDGQTGFVFFNIEGHVYEYNAAARSLHLKDGRVLISGEFANRLGRPADTGVSVGKISIEATMSAIEVTSVVNGAAQSSELPSRPGGTPDVPNLVPGPDVIVGDLTSMQQFGTTGTRVGIAVGTTSCNNGDVGLNWFAMPNTDHPVIPQNVYRMSGGATNDERFEQIGQSWLKHAFAAVNGNACGFGCSSSGSGLRPGCSDPYGASLNASQSGLGSRAWVNPFTGAYPSTARDHTGHSDTSTAATHRALVEMNDLNMAMNPGATYYAEAQYVTPHEYAWCQSHPGQCNMYNNMSYRRFNVSGTTSFTFSAVGNTVRMEPAIKAWTGATINTIEPVPGTDGQAFIAYKVTNPSAGVWHYEYAINNQNLDRSIQSFSVPLGCGITVSNLGFHAPPNHPGIANDGTQGSAGYSNAAWTSNQSASALSWSSETFAQNPNANALRWGTLYNFRFDSNRPPQAANATIGFFKTGAPVTVAIQGPAPCNPLTLASAVSRKTHGAAGTFDIDMPLPPSAPGVECRNTGAGAHTIVVTFSNNVVSGNAAVTNGTGAVSGSPTFSGNTMTVNLTGVPNAQQLTVTLSGVTDSFAQTYPDTPLVIKALFGDIGGNSGVSSSDIAQVKSEASNPVTQINFRADVTAEGAVTSSDIGAVKSMAGAVLP